MRASRIEELIAEATVDCYNESEEVTGLFTKIEENLELPFDTSVLGVRVSVVGLDLTADGSIVAICRRGRARQRIPVLDLTLPEPAPAGTEWVVAYRRWARRR